MTDAGTSPRSFEHRPIGYEYTRGELESITGLLHRAYAPLGASGYNYTAVDQTDVVTSRRLSTGETIFCRADRAIVGVITVYRKAFGANVRCATYCEPDVASFGQFAVEPALQRTNIGSQLLRRAEGVARRFGCARLACDTAAPAGHLRAYYVRRGYREVESLRWDGKTYESVVLAKDL